MFSVTLSPRKPKPRDSRAASAPSPAAPDARGAESGIHPRVKFQLMLGEVTQLDALRRADFTLDRIKLARQQFDQRGFTGTVASQQTNT